MAEKMVVDETPAGALPLFVSESEKMKQTKQERAAPPLLVAAVRDVILWTLFHAGNVTAVSIALYMIRLIITIFSQPPSWLLPCSVDEVDMAGAIAAGMLWNAVSQATTGALSLMLPRLRRRRRLVKAYETLVATVAGYSMWAGLHRFFVDFDPASLCVSTGEAATVLILEFILGVGVLGLILRGGEEEDEVEEE